MLSLQRSILRLCLGSAAPALFAGAVMAQSSHDAAVETVVVTGSLIHGAAQVGTPVTALGDRDIADTGALNLADVMRATPAAGLLSSTAPNTDGGRNSSHSNPVSIHGSNSVLVLVDGLRLPPQNQDQTVQDPSVIPTLAVQSVDVLPDGASATYGSDALSGVVNVKLRRHYEGLQAELSTTYTQGQRGMGGRFSTIWGKTWDGGDVTATYEYYNTPSLPMSERSFYTWDFTPYGYDNRTPIQSSIPAVASTGKPSTTTGTSCTNCFSAPKGSNGVGLTWAQFLANPGVKNEINPNTLDIDLIAEEMRHSVVLTVDQQVLPGISFWGEGWWTNRQSRSLIGDGSQGVNNFLSVVLPSNNPYYPVGAPAGLNVSFTTAGQAPAQLFTQSTSMRGAAGLNLDLPFEWKGKLTAAYTSNEEKANTYNTVNVNNVQAALGATVSVPAVEGINSAYTFTKPVNVPFLNPFCDQQAFSNCIAPTTLAYIEGFRTDYANWITNEYSATFDGPVYDLPGGTIRAAVGATYVQDRLDFVRTLNHTTASTAVITPQPAPGNRNVWAVYAQLNVPVIGDQNRLPLIEKLTVQAEVRHDQYSSGIGGTNNPKLSLDWVPIEDLTVRASWGTSFIAPSFLNLGSIGPNAKGVFFSLNLPAGAAINNTPICPTIGATPPAGSAAAILNPTCSAALNFPGGVRVGQSVGVAQSVGILPPGSGISPQKGTNASFGFDYAPASGFLAGFEADVTYWFTKTTDNIATGCTDFFNPSCTQYIITSSNPNYANILAAVLASPNNTVPPSLPASGIKFLINNAPTNIGTSTNSGVDFKVQYNWEWQDIGVFRAGMAGSLDLLNASWDGIGTSLSDYTNGRTTSTSILGVGYPLSPGWRARYNLGWTLGPWSMDWFLNYTAHNYTNDQLPPGATLATFSELQGARYIFDLSLGFNTEDRFEEFYLNNVRVSLNMNNVFDTDPRFEYSVGGNAARNGLAAYNLNDSPLGRTITLRLTKRM